MFLIGSKSKQRKEMRNALLVTHNIEYILQDIDLAFEELTGLDKKDIYLLFFAVGLQTVRQILIKKLTHIEAAGQGNLKEAKLKEFQKWAFKNFDDGKIISEKPYYASLNHIITKAGVPYDATRFLDDDTIKMLIMKDSSWSFGIDEFVTKKLPLFKGANHRFSTLGHDPIIGLIFGTGNIMTNTISTVNKGAFAVPLISTNHVIYTSDYKHPVIGIKASTVKMLGQAAKRTKNEPKVFAAALIKQIIHIGTDLYTPFGIQLPGENLILSNTNVERITKYVSTGDVIKIGASAGLSELINILIASLHCLMYSSNDIDIISKKLFAVKTQKIIKYSNTISSTSNVLFTALNIAYGNTAAIKDFDIGGLIITLQNLLKSKQFIRKVKREFIISEIDNAINGKSSIIKGIN